MSEYAEFPSLPLDELIKSSELGPVGNMANKVYALLRQLIIEVRLLPGRSLSEKEVAAILNISKTPVREAMIERLRGIKDATNRLRPHLRYTTLVSAYDSAEYPHRYVELF